MSLVGVDGRAWRMNHDSNDWEEVIAGISSYKTQALWQLLMHTILIDPDVATCTDHISKLSMSISIIQDLVVLFWGLQYKVHSRVTHIYAHSIPSPISERCM